MLLNRPDGWTGIETVNDLDGFVANAWRSIQHAPEETAGYADLPVFENDLHARHSWLVGQRESLRARLEGDPEFYDAKIAGWWLWGIACWIGGGFCSGVGPWHVENGQLVRAESDGQGVQRKRVHLSNAGQGVKRQRVHLGAGRGVKRQLVHLGNAGMGVNRQLVHLGDAGRGVKRKLVHLGDAGQGLIDWFADLSARLARVRVCSGDWSRVCGPTPTWAQGMTGVFLDPPYADTAERDADIYAVDSLTVAHEVREWAIENGENELLRIALCGYDGEHEMPASWAVHRWTAHGGYANSGGSRGESGTENRDREVIWFSPACLPGSDSVPAQGSLF